MSELGNVQEALDQKLMPNLFVIGASKSGSSALHAYLKLHPQIDMSVVKEPCFFVDHSELLEAWPIMARNPASYDRTAYLALFQGSEKAEYRGEASVYYSQFPHKSGVPERIASTCPQARIIYVVREPVSRAISHYWQRAKEFQEERDLDEAVRENSIYRDTSDYAMQLKEYLRVFDQSQIHVVLAEDLRSNRRETLAQLFEWLGIEPFDHADSDLADVHVSSSKSRRQRFGFVRSLRNSGLWALVRERLPRRVLDGLREAATTSFDKEHVDDRAARIWLQDYFAPRIEELEKLLGRSLHCWKNTGSAK